MIGQTISHYKILAQLGEGGMGVVYAAEDLSLGRRVALKVPTASSAQNERHYHARLLREARAVSSLNHPHIAAVYDYGETSEGQPFIVMELIQGQTLSELLLASELTISRAVEIIIDVAEAIGEAHRHGIIHRDIKPSNVIISDRNEVKVLDFGLAKQLEEVSLSGSGPHAQTLLATQTQSNVVLGTPLYLSPEQARGAKVDQRSDIFALGALFYECLAGRPAFSGANFMEIGGQVLHVDPPPPSKFNFRVSKELDRITLKALAKEIETRYQSVDAFLADLRAAHAKLSRFDNTRIQRLTTQIDALTGRSSVLITLSENLRRPRLSPLAFIIALIALSFAVWLYWRVNSPSVHQPEAKVLELCDKGTNLMRQGAFHQAGKEFERAIGLDDKYALAYVRLAEALREMDFTARATEELLRARTLIADPSLLPKLDRLYFEAVTATAMQEFVKAVSSYQDIVKLKPKDPYAHLDLGRAYEKDNRIDKALEQYKEATGLDLQNATAFLRMGILYGRQQNLSAASAAFKRAEELYQLQQNLEGQIEVLYQRGFLANKNDDKTQARGPLRQALDMARSNGSRYQQIQALLKLSDIASEDGKAEEAEQYVNEAINLARDEGMDNLIVRGLVDLGNIFFRDRKYKETERHFRDAVNFAQRLKGSRSEALARLSLGSVLTSLEKAEEAIPHAESALNFYDKGNYHTEAVQARLVIGRARRLKGDYQAALVILSEALAKAQAFNALSQVALSYEYLGNLHSDQEEYQKALDHYSESYTLNKQIKWSHKANRNQAEIAHLLWKLGRMDEARRALEELDKITARSESDKSLLGLLHIIKARIAISERRFPEASLKCQQALALKDSLDESAIIEAKSLLGLALISSGKKRDGQMSCEEAGIKVRQVEHLALRNRSILVCAQAMVESGDSQGGLKAALEVQPTLSVLGQQDSEWTALMIAALASKRIGDKARMQEYASKAAQVFSSLKQRWGENVYNRYLTRPDIQHAHRQLGELLAKN